MNCEECEKLIWQYLDGELDGVSSEDLQRHLEGCRECFSHAEFERQVKELVRRSCGSEQAPPELRERLSRLLRLF
jgi:mycothiol system anti-sigma-R factor